MRSVKAEVGGDVPLALAHANLKIRARLNAHLEKSLFSEPLLQLKERAL
jgi:hypothetical protein